MPKVTITGTKIKTLIEVSILELELEANALLDRAILERAKLVADGVPASQAENIIIDQILTGTDFVQAWNNKADRIVHEMTKQLVAKPTKIYSDKNPTQLYEWVLGSVKTSHCPDCLRLSGMEARTIPEWEAEGKGLPREGGTVCNVGCKCMLSPVNTL